MNRRSVLTILVLVWSLLSIEAQAQSFTFVPDDTSLSAPLGSEIVFNCTLTNTSTTTVTLAIVRVINNLPAPWESSMCLNVCFPSTVDSILTTPEYGSTPLSPGESRPFSLHVYTTTNNGTGTVRIAVRDTRNPADQHTVTFTASTTPVGVQNETPAPTTFSLSECYPNPFNPGTSLRYSLPGESVVTLKVFNIAGQEMGTLADRRVQSGIVEVQWDARDMRGAQLPSGVYFCRMDARLLAGHEYFTATRKLLLLR